MAQHIHSSHGRQTLISDTCFRCHGSVAVPEDTCPGDALQCNHCGGWLQVLSRASDDMTHLSIWLSPFDRTARSQGRRDMKTPATTPEPAPVRTDSPAVWPLVIRDVSDLIPYAPLWVAHRLREDMQARHESGLEKYGVPLQVENGRRADVDAYQEALDLCAYSRQQVERTPCDAWRRIHNEAVRLAAAILYQMELEKEGMP